MRHSRWTGGALDDSLHEVSSLTDAEIIQQVRVIEAEIKELEEIEHKAKKVVTRINDLKKSIEDLNAILDQRPDTPPKA